MAKEAQVHYLSPFGSPAWMSREQAEKLLAEDSARYERYRQWGYLSDEQEAAGPPRIEK